MGHDYFASGAAAITLLCLLPSASHADDVLRTEGAAKARSFSDITENFSVRIGLESAGPLLFEDTADQRLERTTVFQYGGRLAFLFGSEHKDSHRVGLGVSYNFVAKSESRDMQFVDPYLMYETGYPFVLQLHAGASLATGTKELADAHGGLYSAAALRYSLDRTGSAIFRVSPGIVAKSYLVTSDMRNSSFFVGGQVEFTFNTDG